MRQQNTWQVHSHMSCTGRPFADWITFLGLNDRITFLWLNPCCISGLSLTSTRSTWFLCWCAIGQDIAHYSTHPRGSSTLFEFSKKGATCATDHDMASLGVSSTKVSVPNRKKEWDVSILCGAESPAQPARSNSTKARMHREPDICLVHHTWLNVPVPSH